MVVGDLKLNYDVIKTFLNHPEDIVAYCESCIPVWAQHIQQLKFNQRYYMAIHIRDLKNIPFRDRQALVEPLIKGITLVGVMSSFTSITDIIEACDKETLLRVVKEYLKDENQFKKKEE